MVSTNKRADNDPPRKIPTWALVLMALVLGNGVAYFVYENTRGAAKTNGQKAEVPALPEARVSFDSDPQGARVSEDNEVIGVTPFVRNFSRLSPEKRHEFTFELDGHEPAKVRANIDQDRIMLQTALVKAVRRDPQNETAKVAEPARAAEPEGAESEAVPAVEDTRAGFSRRQHAAAIAAARRRAAMQQQAAQLPPSKSVAVSKVDDDRGVPKLGDERSGVPKLTDERGGVPKLKDDRSGVPKLGDERTVPKVEDGKTSSSVPKLRDDAARVPKLGEDKKSKEAVPKLD